MDLRDIGTSIRCLDVQATILKRLHKKYILKIANRAMQKKIIIIADDFTGANDTGVQFRMTGLKVNVIISTLRLKEDLELTDVLVIDLESRFDTKDAAYQKCFNLGKQILNLENTFVYKKLDSTFRGNIGSEIDGLMDSLHIKLLLLAPAWPANGRITKNGKVFIHGTKLAETEAANDLRNPIKHSRIAEIIRLQSKRTCSEIPTKIFQEGTAKKNELMLKELDKGSEILIFDSLKEDDLENIANFIKTISNLPILIAGSAGLASHLCKHYVSPPDPVCFIFSGSVSEKSSIQLKHTISQGNCRLYFLEGEDLLKKEFNPDLTIASVSEDIGRGIRRFIFTSAMSRDDVEKIFRFAHEKGIEQYAVAEKVAMGIGRLAASLIRKFNPTGVLLTGGDIAIKTVLALGASGINIDQEILPGIQAGTLTGCAIRSIIATKAGGFGNDDAISETLNFFKV